ncbi:MAG: AsnC family transcriptional regulator [Dehalococcoidia bacterium]|nr:AsnC family transcriptional regulator [Dehalococcoidia bacterium]
MLSKKAYLLIESEPGSTSQLISDLTSVKEITAVEFVSGPYDFIAEIEVDDVSQLGSLITNVVHPIKGIDRTVTCISIE